MNFRRLTTICCAEEKKNASPGGRPYTRAFGGGGEKGSDHWGVARSKMGKGEETQASSRPANKREAPITIVLNSVKKRKEEKLTPFRKDVKRKKGVWRKKRRIELHVMRRHGLTTLDERPKSTSLNREKTTERERRKN